MLFRVSTTTLLGFAWMTSILEPVSAVYCCEDPLCLDCTDDYVVGYCKDYNYPFVAPGGSAGPGPDDCRRVDGVSESRIRDFQGYCCEEKPDNGDSCYLDLETCDVETDDYDCFDVFFVDSSTEDPRGGDAEDKFAGGGNFAWVSYRDAHQSGLVQNQCLPNNDQVFCCHQPDCTECTLSPDGTRQYCVDRNDEYEKYFSSIFQNHECDAIGRVYCCGERDCYACTEESGVLTIFDTREQPEHDCNQPSPYRATLVEDQCLPYCCVHMDDSDCQNVCECCGEDVAGAGDTCTLCPIQPIPAPAPAPAPVPSPLPDVCPADVRRCPDGSIVRRDPLNGCVFHECPISDCCIDMNDSDCQICECCGEELTRRLQEKHPGAGSTCTICPEQPIPAPAPAPAPAPGPVDGKDSVVSGDPHIRGWNGHWFDYQGSCDLLYLMVENIIDGLSMWIYIRTTSRVDFSYIESAVIQVGDNVLEVNGHGQYALDWVDNAALDETTTLGGAFPIYHSKLNDKQDAFDIGIGPSEFITISSYKDILSVKVTNGTAAHFKNSIGLLGNYTTGELLSRDGVVMTDMDAYGSDWQVRDDEPKLFRVARSPQYPDKCQFPSEAMKAKQAKRLGGNIISKEAAEQACGHLKDAGSHNACVNDVLLMQDLEIASAY